MMENELTEILLAFMRAGNYPWRTLSGRGIPRNPLTGRKFNGIELLVLSAVADQRQYRSRYWGTLRDWSLLGMTVRERPANLPDSMKAVTVLEGTRLFNTEQIVGPGIEKYLAPPRMQTGRVDYSEAEAVIAATGARIRHHRSCRMSRYLRPPLDRILLPSRTSFLDAPQYVATKLHEVIHHSESRLQWSGPACQGELIAECATGILEAELGLPHDTDTANHQKWLPTWIEGIQASPSYLIEAAAQASRAADFVLGFSRQQNRVETSETQAISA
jgi:antirestriction protein ArdC